MSIFKLKFVGSLFFVVCYLSGICKLPSTNESFEYIFEHVLIRYLHVRWGVELSKMLVFVGECGDTDYEGLLGGVHKSVILKGVCSSAANQLHANRGYPLSDVISLDSPHILETAEDCSSSEIRDCVEKLGLLKG